MKDVEIRAELHRRLSARHSADPAVRIVDEMGVLRGRNRIDVAVINGRLDGFEIKSEHDSLARLERQAAAYEQVFDRLTVICVERHLDRACEMLPDWWGVEVAQASSDGLKIVRWRDPRVNEGTDPAALAQLLWREEALGVLSDLGLDEGLRTKSRKVIWRALVDSLAPRELAAAVRGRLRARAGWLAVG